MACYENIPQEMRDLPQWVCADNADKAPKNALFPCYASSVDPATWTSYTNAVNAWQEGKYPYCGFVFADNGLVGIDIDAGYDADGFMTPLASDIIGACQSYTEKSKSGRGFHIIVRGTLPFKGKNNLAGVEIYRSARYFIMTGDVVVYQDIIDNQQAIDYVLEKYFPATREETGRTSYSERVYHPVWDNALEDGRIKLRPVYPRIPDGCRNICLTSLAGMMHNIGYSPQQILNELQYCNTTACDPPLPTGELLSICNSVTKYKR